MAVEAGDIQFTRSSNDDRISSESEMDSAEVVGEAIMVSDEFHAINQIRSHLRDMRKTSSEGDVFRIDRIEFYLGALEKKIKKVQAFQAEDEAIGDLIQTMREHRNAGD